MGSAAAAVDASAESAIHAFEGIEGPVRLRRLGAGLVNDTFAVDTDTQAYVLQRVHGIFQPEVHINIAAASNHLRAKGFPSPMLVRGHDGFPWVEIDGSVWRLMTRLPGSSVEIIEELGQAEIGARAFARFHGALEDVEFDFLAFHLDVHDTAGHLQRMVHSHGHHGGHRLFDEVAPLMERIVQRARQLPVCDGLPKRIVHGDPKIGNVLFDDAGRIAGIIDLDTVGPLPLHLELGDMWRSWCNPQGESAPDAVFDLAIFEASLAAYADELTFALAPEEREAVVHGVEWITLEQTARFATDALNECYFGWDADAFASAGDHNLARARNQWQLHEQVLACRAERAALVERHFR